MCVTSSTVLNRRYKYAVGLFFLRRDLEKALDDLRKNEFPMEKVKVVAKSANNFGNIAGVSIVAPQFNFSKFEIPDDIAKHYNYRVLLGDYLVLLSGTAIQLAAAENILGNHHIQNYSTFHPNVATRDAVNYNYRFLDKDT